MYVCERVCMYGTKVCGVEGQRSAIQGVQHSMARAVSCTGAAVSLATLAILRTPMQLSVKTMYVCMYVCMYE